MQYISRLGIFEHSPFRTLGTFEHFGTLSTLAP
jgi:hypothetical protein